MEQPEQRQREAERLTIDQLAHAAGLTVRNVRNYQSRGLIPPPEVQGRVGYYGREHLARLELIREMQAQGFNLAAIGHLLERARAPGEEILGFTRALMRPFETETPEVLSAADLERRLGAELDGKLLERHEKLGLIAALGNGFYEVPSPTLLLAGERLVALGVPLAAALEMVQGLRRNMNRSAHAFVALFVEHIWKPVDQAGREEADLARVWAALDELRPLASQALTAVFQQEMTRSVEEAFGKELERGNRA